MFECKKCGREAGREILTCPERVNGECPYKLRLEEVESNRWRARGFFWSGVVVLAAAWHFSVGEHHGPADLSLLVIDILGALALFSLAFLLLIWGVFLLFGKKLTVYSLSEGRLWQIFAFGGYEYRTWARVLLPWELKFQAPLEFNFPPEFSALTKPGAVFRSLKRLSGSKDSDLEHAREAQAIILEQARLVLDGALLGLLSGGQLQLRKASRYRSVGKTLERTETVEQFLLCEGSAPPGQTMGAVSRRIHETAQRIWREEEGRATIFAPTLKELINRSFPGKAQTAATEILELVRRETVGRFWTASGEVPPGAACQEALAADRKLLKQLLREFSRQNQGSDTIDRLVRRAFVAKGAAVDDAENTTAANSKNLRVSLAVLVVISVFMVRAWLQYNRVTQVKNTLVELEEAAVSSAQVAYTALLERLVDYRSSMTEANFNRAIKESLPALKRLFAGTDQYAQALIARLLAGTESPEVKQFLRGHLGALLGLLQSADSEVRAAGVVALAAMDTSVEAAWAAVSRLTQDPAAQVRRESAAALSRFQLYPQLSVSRLTELLRDNDGAVRAAAIAAIGSFGTQGAGAVPQLERLLRGPIASQERALIIRTLEQIGTPLAHQAVDLVR